jgi:hypothetical protein
MTEPSANRSQSISNSASGVLPSRLRRDLRASLGDGAGFSLMVGLGETYLVAFALAVGLDDVIAGLMGTVPMLLGAILQLISPRAIGWVGSLRRWVTLCALVQALALIPLGIAALRGTISAPALLLIATIYWGSALATGPAWNTWVGSIIPTRIRAPFMARRSRICQFAVLIGLVISGLSLHFGKQADVSLVVYAVLFFVAAGARVFSATCLWAQSDARARPSDLRLVTPRDMLRRIASGADGRLLAYMISVQICVQISGPFFTPYMLRRLEFSYAEYLLLISTAFVSKMIALPLLGRIAKRAGAHTLLWTAGIGIVPLAGFWILSDELVYLMGLQVFAGLIWGTYELGTLLLLFDRIEERERTSILTMFNVANALAMVGGSLLGAAVLGAIQAGPWGEWGDGRFSYHALFGLTTAARLGTLLLLRRVVAPPERPLPVPSMRLPWPRVLAVRPNIGSIDRPLLPAAEDAYEPVNSEEPTEPPHRP